MTWQNSQLLSRNHAPADPGSQVPKAEVPSIQNGRLRALKTQVPAAEAVAVAVPDGTGSPVNLVPTGRSRCRPSASRPWGPRSIARPGLAFPAAPSRLQRAWRDHQAAQTKRPAAPGAEGAETGARLPPSLARPPPASRRPQSTWRPGPTPSPPRGRRSGPARQGAAGRPRGAGAGEGAAAATMSARPSQKQGAQRTMRRGGAGGTGAQADPADPRGISGARSPGNPAP